jgi:VWFA-related protein
VICAAALSANSPAQQQAQPPTFRAGVVLVPIDVRVVDGKGRPVTDLTAEDFTIVEDGVPQRISHFSVQDYANAPVPERPVVRRRGVGLDPSVATRRTFLIVLGRGRLQGPSEGLTAVMDMVRTRLLPQDHVGVLAFDRVTDLTTDRESVLALLERYRTNHERVEALLANWFTGLTLGFSSPGNPPEIQKYIDEVFDVPGLPRLRRLHALVPPGLYEGDETREGVEELPFRSVVYNTAAAHEREKLFAAVNYLRFVDGEKHVIFLTQEGSVWMGPRADWLTRMASDARVAITMIHTGGLQTKWVRSGTRVDYHGPSWTQLFANIDSHWLAQETGGFSTLYRYAKVALDALERSTRVQYLLGYYPTNTQWDGTKRRIEVKVRRSGVRVLYRHSYDAHDELKPWDPRAARTVARIDAASAYRMAVADIPVRIVSAVAAAKNAPTEVLVTINVDRGGLSFVEADGRHVAALDVGVFVGSKNDRQIGETRKRVDLKLTPATYARAADEGITFTATVAVATGTPHYVKVIVYDYDNDLLGSTVARVTPAASR